MGMTYIVNNEQVNHLLPDSIDVNSTEDIYLTIILTLALIPKHSDIYDKLTEEVIFNRFDNLSEIEFITAYSEIEKLKTRVDLNDAEKKGLDLWNNLLNPLIRNDIRYKN